MYKQSNCPITTKWAENIDPESLFPEYPRPQMLRADWLNLNGLWDYIISRKGSNTGAKLKAEPDGKILVPFAVETALSGVCKPLLPSEELVYRRRFSLPSSWLGKRVLLNFEAVDYECECFINKKTAGVHRGGYLPFSFDITDSLTAGDNELILIVTDPTDKGGQQRGKQVLKPGTIYYTATSGIWQPVWLEAVDLENYIRNVMISSDADSGNVVFRIETGFPAVTADVAVIVEIRYNEKKIHSCRWAAEGALTAGSINIAAPELWSPGNPALYDVFISLCNGAEVLDSVVSYFAFRTIEIKPDSKGRKRIFLNGGPVFLHAPLDQGYWPESGMTPPSDEAMIFDIQKTKDLGFNCTRKHIKIEPRRWYYHADRLGLMVMQDMVSGGRNMLGLIQIWMTISTDKQGAADTTSGSYIKAGRSTPESRQLFENELEDMMIHLGNHPSIIMWIPFNEAWGQFDSARIAEKVLSLDSSRLIDPASGWLDQGTGEFRSRHTYSVRLKTPPVNDRRIYFISEYGGYNLLIEDHLWNKKRKFGYKTESNFTALEKAYTGLIREQLIPLLKNGLGAAVYTQLADVEIESNGFFTYDRKILKIPEEKIRALNEEIFRQFEAECF